MPTLDAVAPAEEATVDIADPAADAPDLTAPPAEDKTEDAAPGAIIAPASKAPPTPLAPLDIKLPAPFRAPPIRPPFVGVPGGKGGPIPPGPSLPPIRAVAYIAATDADILPKRAGNPNRFARKIPTPFTTLIIRPTVLNGANARPRAPTPNTKLSSPEMNTPKSP